MEDVYLWADIYGPSPRNPNENVFSLCVLAEDYEKAIKEIENLHRDIDRLQTQIVFQQETIRELIEEGPM